MFVVSIAEITYKYCYLSHLREHVVHKVTLIEVIFILII